MKNLALVALAFASLSTPPLFAADSSPAGTAAPLPAPAVVRGFNGRPSDAARMKSWGANVFRMWIMPGREDADLEAKLEAVRQVGGIKVVLTRGGAAGPKGAKWSDPDFGQPLIEGWRDLARRLLPYRDVIWGYDLYNEPLDRTQLPRTPKQWRSLAIRIVEAIRAVDDQTWIIYEVGPSGSFSGFKDLEPLPDPRVIYSAHYYFPHEFTHAGIKTIKGTPLTEVMKTINVPYPVKIADLHQSDWEINMLTQPPMSLPRESLVEWNQELQRRYTAPAREFQQKYHVPIFVGEFSAVSWAPAESLARYLREAIEIFEENGWSWAYHTFNGGAPFWNAELPEGPENYEKLMAGAKPDGTETRRMKLLKAALAKNRAE